MKFLKTVLGCVFMFNICAVSAAVYLIDTPNFQEVYGEYTLGDNLFGTVVTNQQVTPNAGLVDISSILDSYDFSDGVQQFTEQNSVPLSIRLSVNGQDELIGAAITFWKTPITTMSGGPVEGMDIYISETYWQISGFKDGECQQNNGPGGACSGAFFGGINSGLYLFIDEIFIHGFDF